MCKQNDNGTYIILSYWLRLFLLGARILGGAIRWSSGRMPRQRERENSQQWRRHFANLNSFDNLYDLDPRLITYQYFTEDITPPPFTRAEESIALLQFISLNIVFQLLFYFFFLFRWKERVIVVDNFLYCISKL